MADIANYVYFSLCRFFTIEFTNHVMLLPPMFGRFYYALMKEFTHPFIKSTSPTHAVSKRSSVNGQSKLTKTLKIISRKVYKFMLWTSGSAMIHSMKEWVNE